MLHAGYWVDMTDYEILESEVEHGIIYLNGCIDPAPFYMLAIHILTGDIRLLVNLGSDKTMWYLSSWDPTSTLRL